jgi:hypothetical protein
MALLALFVLLAAGQSHWAGRGGAATPGAGATSAALALIHVRDPGPRGSAVLVTVVETSGGVLVIAAIKGVRLAADPPPPPAPRAG